MNHATVIIRDGTEMDSKDCPFMRRTLASSPNPNVQVAIRKTVKHAPTKSSNSKLAVLSNAGCPV